MQVLGVIAISRECGSTPALCGAKPMERRDGSSKNQELRVLPEGHLVSSLPLLSLIIYSL